MLPNKIIDEVIDHIKIDTTIPNETKVEFANQILDKIIDSIIEYYKTHKITQKNSSYSSSQNQENIHLNSKNTRKSAGFWYCSANNKKKNDNEKPIFLSDFVEKHKFDIIRTLNFKSNKANQQYPCYHVKVHQQFVWNLCGYHALFSFREVLKLLKSQDIEHPIHLYNPASFWKFHFDCTNHLDNLARKMNFIRTKYPWDYKTIRWGDLERAFVRYLTIDHPEIQELLQETQNLQAKFLVFQFQFKRVMNSEESIMELQAEFDDFNSDKNPNIHKLKFFLLGITNHWVLFLAHRYQSKIEFWYLDSKNRDYLTWDESQIKTFLAEESENRKKLGKIPWKSFDLLVRQNAITDAQIVIKLLIDCLLGNTKLLEYMTAVEVDIIERTFLDNEELANLYKHYPNIDSIISQYDPQNLEDILSKILIYTQSCGEVMYLLLRSQQKAKHIPLNCKQILSKIGNILIRLINDKRNKEIDDWIITYKDVYLYASRLIKN